MIGRKAQRVSLTGELPTLRPDFHRAEKSFLGLVTATLGISVWIFSLLINQG